MKITVQGTDIEGITLTTEAPVTVNGEIAMESGALIPIRQAGGCAWPWRQSAISPRPSSR